MMVASYISITHTAMYKLTLPGQIARRLAMAVVSYVQLC